MKQGTQLEIFPGVKPPPGAIPDKFYNTVRLHAPGIHQAKERNKTANEAVMEVFKKFPLNNFTPWEVLSQLHWPEKAIVQVRRAITDLTKAGMLQKTPAQRLSEEGYPNYCWILNRNQP